MAKNQQPEGRFAVGPTADRNRRDDALQQRYGRRPSLRELYESGQIDLPAYQNAGRLRAGGRRDRPFEQLIITLRAERERQGLSLTEVAERTGIDRAAIHKLEIGLNKNPTCATLARYAEALGVRIKWNLELNHHQGQAAKSKS
jgi:DNA-binding phage protein